MILREVATSPIAGQRPGTSGLRKKVSTFSAPGYLENFVQALFDILPKQPERVLVLGGDGRYFNARAIQIVLRLAAANGFSSVLVGRDGILSTPAASAIIRKHKTIGGIILSASHNPGGPDGDFGVKFNGANGGPANEAMTEAIYHRACEINLYRTIDADDLPIDKVGVFRLLDMKVEVIDPITDYVELLARFFDFDAIRRLFGTGFTMVFDAMNAVNGPYAKVIFEEILGAPAGTVINATPLPDFGGCHPDPNPVHAHELMEIMSGPDAPNFGAASDGDGDRNMIVGRGFPVSPSDSLAILAANAGLVPGCSSGLTGIARSMPTSRAADQVALALNIPCYEVPTGWKFFGSLMDADRINLCGEESYGTGASHIREKDGIWAVLFWLSLIACKSQSVVEIVQNHWRQYGRHYYSRHDYENLEISIADDLICTLREKFKSLAGQTLAGMTVSIADDFSYTDPIDGTLTAKQGLRLIFGDQARIIFRLSGTGTDGAILRIYFERFEKRPDFQNNSPQQALSDLILLANQLGEISERTGRERPDVIT